MERHGKSNTRAYSIWADIKKRCNNKKSTMYRHYGGRGIGYTKKWETFTGFYEDMGDPPEGLEIERKDNNKGYCKNNCTWVSHKEQANNRRSNINIRYKTKTFTIKQASEEFCIPYRTLLMRVKNGWAVSIAIEKPVRRLNNKITYNGTTKTRIEWSLFLGGTKELVTKRLLRGWTIKQAVSIKNGDQR